jgi:hypothetical protein
MVKDAQKGDVWNPGLIQGFAQAKEVDNDVDVPGEFPAAVGDVVEVPATFILGGIQERTIC